MHEVIECQVLRATSRQRSASLLCRFAFPSNAHNALLYRYLRQRAHNEVVGRSVQRCANTSLVIDCST
ncbi:hypothetical protein CKO51_17035 [Rhodopirellula sp. SM50]|nr:hypothetical protein CKO51_17035 [Rhodopirellula sp. SM50]